MKYVAEDSDDCRHELEDSQAPELLLKIGFIMTDLLRNV